MTAIALEIRTSSGTGVLHQLTGVIARHGGDITTVEIVERGPDETRICFEVDLPGSTSQLLTGIARARGRQARRASWKRCSGSTASA